MTRAINLGNVTIHRVVELEAQPFDGLTFFPGLTREILDENREWLEPEYFDAAGNVLLCIQSYVVRTPRHVILVDSCVGNHKPRPTLPSWSMMASDRYEKNLMAAGLAPSDVDFVMCTHLHVDHVGWNTRLENGRWVPTFPKARYLFSGRELDHWMMRQRENPQDFPWIGDSVLPIIEARREERVKSDHVVEDLVRLVPTPGHTVDHFSVAVGGREADAIITGDMIHSPIQLRYPELGMFIDHDSRQAGATRRLMFERICDTSTLLCTAHFASPSVGRIVRHGSGFDFVPIPDRPGR